MTGKPVKHGSLLDLAAALPVAPEWLLHGTGESSTPEQARYLKEKTATLMFPPDSAHERARRSLTESVHAFEELHALQLEAHQRVALADALFTLLDTVFARILKHPPRGLP